MNSGWRREAWGVGWPFVSCEAGRDQHADGLVDDRVGVDRLPQ